MTNVLAHGVRRCVRAVTVRTGLRPMHDTDYLAQLRTEWHREGHSRRAERACDYLRARHPDTALVGCLDLGEVVGRLEQHSGLSAVEKARILEALLVEATDPAIRRALVQTLLPGVVSVCRQLHFGRGVVDEPSEFLAVAIATLSELVSEWAGQSRGYAGPDLLSALRGRLRRQLLKEKENRDHQAPESDAVTTAEDALASELRRHLGTEYDSVARAAYAYAVEGRPLRDVARQRGSSLSTLQAELAHFAERFLL